MLDSRAFLEYKVSCDACSCRRGWFVAAEFSHFVIQASASKDQLTRGKVRFSILKRTFELSEPAESI